MGRPAGREKICQGAENEQAPHGNLLQKHGYPQKIQRVANDLEKDHPEKGSRDGTSASIQVRAPDHDSGNDIQLSTRPGLREGRVQAGGQENSGQ